MAYGNGAERQRAVRDRQQMLRHRPVGALLLQEVVRPLPPEHLAAERLQREFRAQMPRLRQRNEAVEDGEADAEAACS
jgi:hypothetical protein